MKVRLTESQLNRIVAESVKKVLREGEWWDTVKGAYRDMRDYDPQDDIAKGRTPMEVSNKEYENYIKNGSLDGDNATNYDAYKKSRDDYRKADKGSAERRRAAYDAVEQRPGAIGRLGRRGVALAAKAGTGVRNVKNFMHNKVGF